MPRHDLASDRPSRQSLDSTVALPPASVFLSNAPCICSGLTDPTILDKVIRPCILRDFRSYPIATTHRGVPLFAKKKKTQRLSACNCKTTIARCITNTRDPLSAEKTNSRSVGAPVSSDRLCVGFSRRERIKRRDTYGFDTSKMMLTRQRHAQQFQTRCDYNTSDPLKLNRSDDRQCRLSPLQMFLDRRS